MFSAGIIFFFIGYKLSAVINNQIFRYMYNKTRTYVLINLIF